jgi:hypothetical protein
MERKVEAVPDSDDQVLQNFFTHSSVDHPEQLCGVSSA